MICQMVAHFAELVMFALDPAVQAAGTRPKEPSQRRVGRVSRSSGKMVNVKGQGR